MYSGVPINCPCSVKIVCCGERLGHGLGDAEVDDLRHRLIVHHGDQHVLRLDVAVDDSLLMGVLHRLAHGNEELQAFFQRELVPVAVVGDRLAVDQFHDKVGPARFRAAGVEDLGDVRMVHHRQGLPLGLEAGQNLPRVHARLDDLQRHPPADRLFLVGKIDSSKTAFAQHAEQFVRADCRAKPFIHGRSIADKRLRGGVGLYVCPPLIIPGRHDVAPYSLFIWSTAIHRRTPTGAIQRQL